MRGSLVATVEMLAVKITGRRNQQLYGMSYLFKSIIIEDFNFHSWQSWKKALALGKILQNITHNSLSWTSQHFCGICMSYTGPQLPALNWHLWFIDKLWGRASHSTQLNSTNRLLICTAQNPKAGNAKKASWNFCVRGWLVFHIYINYFTNKVLRPPISSSFLKLISKRKSEKGIF